MAVKWVRVSCSRFNRPRFGWHLGKHHSHSVPVKRTNARWSGTSESSNSLVTSAVIKLCIVCRGHRHGSDTPPISGQWVLTNVQGGTGVNGMVIRNVGCCSASRIVENRRAGVRCLQVVPLNVE
jgi:hypothetical protein